ncbi:uncharacterized protein SPSK_07684 [Sporothrix schenckii 1099-18]|uniref:Uncharacterized protein n=1 Tax=Sporothrix schenckii 1099-18 TaxID=1397361 RepID=A0A0F2MHD7_SPOSC|nr:uncharacterized protein SPSK_07684 [Sporothrix schenckii 1099-18]KJR89037.1 hypothetical protein SPSK_07684 [Sporothrix schenckii 1099-18]
MTLGNLYTTLDEIQSSLQRIHLQMAPQDRYPPAEPSSFPWSPQYAMLHMSYYQCQCDLYRSFLRGHPDTAAQSCIDEIHPADITLLGSRAIQNARQVLCVLADYDQHADPSQPLDWDAAVCGYQATRFVLFGSTYDRTQGTRSTADTSAVRIAISKGQDVLDTLSRRFAFSVAVQPMRDDLTRLVARYRRLLRSSPMNNDNESVFSAHRGIRIPPGVTKEAGSHQFLAVHSLLLRSDFVDDSREAVREGAARPTASNASVAERSKDNAGTADVAGMIPPAWSPTRIDVVQNQHQRQDNCNTGHVTEYWADAGTDVNNDVGDAAVTTFDLPPLFGDLMGDGPGFDFGLWSDMLGTYGNPVPQGSRVGMDEQQMF